MCGRGRFTTRCRRRDELSRVGIVMDDVVAWLVRWMAVYTYPIVFVGTLVDASGVPFPGRVLLVAAGAAAAAGHASVVVIIALGAAAAAAMDHVWYLGARRGGGRLVRFLQRMTRSRRQRRLVAADEWAGYGAAAIVLGRFFTSLRIVAWPLAAVQGLGCARFLVLDLIGAVVWAATWVLLGWAVGARWRPVAESAGGWLAVAGAALLVAAAVAIAVRVLSRRRG
jgi:membrane protein DedA with SNARE-associated domain